MDRRIAEFLAPHITDLAVAALWQGRARNSTIFEVWAAPEAPETPANGGGMGGLRPHLSEGSHGPPGPPGPHKLPISNP